MTSFEESSARDYEFHHGKRPRGKGHWIFRLHRDGSSTQVEFSGSYTDAKKMAMREARALQCQAVTVEP